MHRKTAYLIICGGVACLGAMGLIAYLRPLTPVQAATIAVIACESKDGQRLWELTPPEERNLYPGLSAAKLQRLLDLCPFGKELIPDPTIVGQINPQSGSADATRQYRMNGILEGLGMHAELREEHRAVVTRPVTTLLYFLLYVSGSKSLRPTPGGASRPPILLQGVSNEARTLSQIGFTGVANDAGTELKPWSALRAELQDRIALTKRIESSQG